MKTYKGSHGEHILEYRIKINQLLSRLTDRYPRLMAVRVDLHYPPILEDTASCFHVPTPKAISKFRDSAKAKLVADRIRKQREGKRIYRCPMFIIWVREFSTSGKCHYHICLLFNKDAYYHLGDYEREDNLRGMITGAWYSALKLHREDNPSLVHFPANCRYVLDSNSPNFQDHYQELLTRLDYLTKLGSKVFGEGGRNFGCSQIEL